MKPELRQEVDDMVSGYTTLILGTNMFQDTFYIRGYMLLGIFMMLDGYWNIIHGTLFYYYRKNRL